MDNDDFERQALDRLPLAQACLTVLDQALRPEDLARLYDRNRGRGYEAELSFGRFIAVLRDCLLGPNTSARPALPEAADRGDLPVSMKAFYDELGHLNPAVGSALLAHAHDRLKSPLPAGVTSPLPACLLGFTVLAIDGKAVKHVPRRLRPLRLDRQTACRLLGGEALVAVDPGTGLPLDMHTDLDGEAGEGPLFCPPPARLSGRTRNPLLVAGRGFGMFEYAQASRDAGFHFVLRRHGNTTFVPDPAAPAVTTTDRHGRAVTDEAGWLARGKDQAEKLPARRVTVGRDKESLRLVTSLTQAAEYPAVDIAEVYRHRWDIERVFSDITTTFGLRHLIGTRPEAGLFQAAFCLVLCGAVCAARHHIAAAQRRAAESVSLEMLWRDVRADLTAAFRMIPVRRLVERIERGMTTEQARARLAELLGACWKTAWAKANIREFDPTKTSTKPAKVRHKKGHDSVHRVLKKHQRNST